MEPKAEGAGEEVVAGAGEGEPNAEVAGLAPNALAVDGVAALAAGDASFAVAESSLSLPDADAKPKPVEPKADAGLPLPAPLLKAPKPKPLAGLEAEEPKAGEDVDALDGAPNAED